MYSQKANIEIKMQSNWLHRTERNGFRNNEIIRLHGDHRSGCRSSHQVHTGRSEDQSTNTTGNCSNL